MSSSQPEEQKPMSAQSHDSTGSIENSISQLQGNQDNSSKSDCNTQSETNYNQTSLLISNNVVMQSSLRSLTIRCSALSVKFGHQF